TSPWMELGPEWGVALLKTLLGDSSGGTTMWIALGPVGAKPLTWKLMLARTPPVWLVMSAARDELATPMSTSPGVDVLGVKVHVPLGGRLVSRAPWVTSAFDTVKTVGSYVRITSAEFRPWLPFASKRWAMLTGTVMTVPWLAVRLVGMLNKAEVAGRTRSS